MVLYQDVFQLGVGKPYDMTEVFVIRHFSTIFDSHGADQKSALRQGTDLFTRLAVEGIDPMARAVKHIHCNRPGAGRSLPEGITYCTELLRFICAHLRLRGCAYILCWSLGSQTWSVRKEREWNISSAPPQTPRSGGVILGRERETQKHLETAPR